MQSLSALRPGEKLENGIYLAVSAAVIFLLLSIIRTPLGWDAAAEGQAIILTTPILAALLFFTRYDEHRAHKIISVMILESRDSLEKFILRASYLFKTWETNVAFESGLDVTVDTVESIVQGNDLRGDIWAVRVGTGFRVIMFCMVLSLSIHVVRSLIGGDFLDPRAIILMASSFVLIGIQDWKLLCKWIRKRQSETVKRGCSLVQYRTLEGYLLLAPLLETKEIDGKADEARVVANVENPLIRQLSPDLEGIEKLILRRNWRIFEMRTEGLFKKIEHIADKAIDGLLDSHEDVCHQYLDSWRLFIERGDNESWQSLVYLRHLIMRMSVHGMVFEKNLFLILKLEPNEVEKREKYLAVSRLLFGAADTEDSGVTERTHDVEFLAFLNSEKFKKERKIMGSKEFGESVETPRRKEKRLLEVISRSPHNPDKWIDLGIALAGQGRNDKAEDAIRKAIELNPDHGKAWHQLGLVLMDLNRRVEAEEAFRKASEFTPDNADAWFYLGVLLREIGRPEKAEEAFRTVTKLNPVDSFAWFNLGVLLDETGRHEEAEEAYRTAIRHSPDDSRFWSNLGVLLDETGRPEEAEEAYRTAIRHSPVDSSAWYNLGLLLDVTGRPKEAEEAYRTAIRHSPDHANAWYNLGLLLRETGRHEEVEEAFRTAIRHSPVDSSAWYNLGLLLDVTGRPKEAEEAYRTAIRHSPDHANAWYNLGLLLRETGRHEEAEEAFRTAIRHSPDHANAWNNLGVLLRETGRHEEAEEAYRTAIRHSPDHANAWYNLGLLLRETGRHEEAEEAFRTATGLNPDDGSPDKTEEDAKNDRDSSKQNPTV